VAAIGPVTAAAMAERGVVADMIPERYCTDGLAATFASLDLQGKRMLLARSNPANPVLPQRLQAMGALVEQVVVYHTVPAEIALERQTEVAEMLRQGEIDLVAFTSSSSARCFADIFTQPDLKRPLRTVSIACLGPETAKTSRRPGLPVQIVAERYTLDGLAETIISRQRRRTWLFHTIGPGG